MIHAQMDRYNGYIWQTQQTLQNIFGRYFLLIFYMCVTYYIGYDYHRRKMKKSYLYRIDYKDK